MDSVDGAVTAHLSVRMWRRHILALLQRLPTIVWRGGDGDPIGNCAPHMLDIFEVLTVEEIDQSDGKSFGDGIIHCLLLWGKLYTVWLR